MPDLIFTRFRRNIHPPPALEAPQRARKKRLYLSYRFSELLKAELRLRRRVVAGEHRSSNTEIIELAHILYKNKYP